MIGGGPASGKTTLARELASRIGAVAISTDDVRPSSCVGSALG